MALNLVKSRPPEYGDFRKNKRCSVSIDLENLEVCSMAILKYNVRTVSHLNTSFQVKGKKACHMFCTFTNLQGKIYSTGW
jgi:hypothetical protein